MIAEARPSLSHLAAQPPRSYSELCCLAAFGLILSAVIDLSAKASGMDSWPGSHCSASGTLLETDGLLGHVHDGSGGHGCFLVRFGYHDTVKLNLRSFLVQLLTSRSQAKSTLVVKGFFFSQHCRFQKSSVHEPMNLKCCSPLAVVGPAVGIGCCSLLSFVQLLAPWSQCRSRLCIVLAWLPTKIF